MEEIRLNPIPEDSLDDKRNEIAENCFVEIDIALKTYGIRYGEDITYEELLLLHTTFAYILSNHKTKHQLSNIDIEKFAIPNSPFKTVDDVPTDKIYHLKDDDALHFIMNMVMNCKSGFNELSTSGYFAEMNEDLMMDSRSLFFQFGSMLDRSILLMNNKYSKLILNIK